MRHYFCRLTPVEKWRWIGMRLRLALYANEPRLLDEYLAIGEWLECNGFHSRWQVALEACRLLLATAADPALPMHWRALCLDRIHEPMDQLASLAPGCADHELADRQLAGLRWKLAHLDMSTTDDSLRD
ncbi:hypothetical protein [Uliginosibacterium sp. H1]|uniref:hypothetical protein n=1 Tax=Uliginosibacterium sp. H1 TaxID=3114757 RepID=UPI002E1835A1|nr:hypothetical protein [Uliginosibacterium sp. H1]